MILLSLSFTFPKGKVVTYNLTEALEKGVAEIGDIEISGERKLKIRVKNLSSRKDIRIKFTPGLQFASQDTSEQDQVLIRGGNYLVRAGRHIAPSFPTFCTQSNYLGAGEGSMFALKTSGNDQLLALAEYLNTHRYLGDAAQHAVWVITNDHDLRGLHLDDKSKALQLQSFVAELTGKPLPAYTVRYRRVQERRVAFAAEAITIHGIHKYDLQEDAYLSCTIYNEKGEAVQKLFEQMHQRAGHNKIDFTFEARDLPKGKYVSKIFSGDKIIQEIWIES